MVRIATAIVGVLLCAGPGWSQDPASKKLPNGVYAVLREDLDEQMVLPIRAGEALAVQRHRYQKVDEKTPPRYLVVRPSADVEFDLAEPPNGVKEGGEVVRILLKLRPDAAKKLAILTAENIDKHVAIILGGEVVTMHRIREAIRGGEVQITNCAPGAANFLLKEIQNRVRITHVKTSH